MIKLLFQLCLTLVFLFILQGCSSNFPTMPNLKQFSEVGPAKSRQVLNSMLDKRANLEAIQSSVKLEAKGSLFEKRFNLAIAADDRNRLRMELFPSNLASPALLASVNRSELTVIDRAQRTAWRGALSDELVEELTGIPLNSTQIFPWLSGTIPFKSFLEGLKSYSYLEEKSGNRSILRLRDKKGFEYNLLLKLIYGNLELYESELSFKGEPKSFTRYTRSPTTGSLQGLKLWLAGEGTEIKLDYPDLVVNPNWSEATREKIFSLKVPRTFQVRPVNELLK